MIEIEDLLNQYPVVLTTKDGYTFTEGHPSPFPGEEYPNTYPLENLRIFSHQICSKSHLAP